MSKQWPKCQTNLAARKHIFALADNVVFEDEPVPKKAPWGRTVVIVDERCRSADCVQYTRTDIAEARIAELDAEVKDLTDQLARVLPSETTLAALIHRCWLGARGIDGGRRDDESNDELPGIIETTRRERDALQQQIDKAPTLTVEHIDQVVQFATREIGKRFALVALP